MRAASPPRGLTRAITHHVVALALIGLCQAVGTLMALAVA